MDDLKIALEICFEKEISSINHMDAEGCNIIFKDGTSGLKAYSTLMRMLAKEVIRLDTQSVILLLI